MKSMEDIDLARLARDLRREFEHDPPVGYLRGRTRVRDTMVTRLGFSALEAEKLVDTLESRGFLRFEGDPRERSRADAVWEIKLRH